MSRFFSMVVLWVIASLLVACSDDSTPYSSGDSGTDTDSDVDTDTDVDTDGDSDTDTDTDTDIPENPCPDGQHAVCYADDVWCADESDTPLEMFDDCTGGELCVELSEEVAVCQCTSDAYRECYGGDVWAYDSCDELDFMVADCSDSQVCTELDGELGLDCCEPSPSVEQCAGDGDVHSFLQCSLNGSVDTGDVALDCNEHAVCTDLTASTAECTCTNHWTGDGCTECEPHWDPAADCNECAGYWTGTECDSCEGFGSDADHCQCPDDTFVPQPGSERCWTCPVGNVATDGVCSTMTNDHLTWDEANASCPAGFVLPTELDFMTLFDGCVVTEESILCDDCEDSAVCNGMYGASSITGAWTSRSCGGLYHRSYTVAMGDYWFSSSSTCHGSTEVMTSTVCVLN